MPTIAEKRASLSVRRWPCSPKPETPVGPIRNQQLISPVPLEWDNAPMESFFHTLKTERVHHRVYATRDQARRDLIGYIEGSYNSRRLHSALGYISSAEMARRAA